MPHALLGGVRLHYQEMGTGEPLVLLHGIGASLDDWEFQMPTFARHFRVIAPDLRGYGKSERQEPYTVAQFAKDIWALLDHLGVDRLHLIGHSMGGAVALQMAVDHPERIDRLVLADTLPSFRANTLAKRMLFATRYATMGLLGPRRLASAISRKLFPGDDQMLLRDRVTQRSEDNDRGVYLETIRGLVGWAVDDRLARLSMPAFVIVAEFDYFPVVDALNFAAALPNAEFRIFPGAHHALPLECPRPFNAAVLRFLKPPKRRAVRADAVSR
ncbi:MAG: alpha/beta fold hydrolase [Nevskia sp.]